MRWVGPILQCLHWLKVLVWAERHEKGCVALCASPAWATQPGVRHSPALAPARTEKSCCHTRIVFTHAGLSADENKSPPWLICAWLTNCVTEQTSRSCGKPRCTEARGRWTVTPLSSQRGSHRTSGHGVVPAELGQCGHSPAAAPVLLGQPQRLPATNPSLLLVSQHLCPKWSCRGFEEASWSKVVVVQQGTGAGDSELSLKWGRHLA